ncbi:hypothetical protein B551_0222525 [Cupriavidus sp. HPC(L)]|nr:hypothetical protein B551_0222525 [Cupriavidus sp. HPC(L)]
MFDFPAWADAYIRPLFGGDAEMRFPEGGEESGVAFFSWPLPIDGREKRRGSMVIALEGYVLHELRSGEEDRRAEIGMNMSRFLMPILMRYDPDKHPGGAPRIEITSEVTDRR